MLDFFEKTFPIKLFLVMYVYVYAVIIYRIILDKRIDILSPYNSFSFIKIIVIFSSVISLVSIFITSIYFGQDSLFNFFLFVAVLLSIYVRCKMNFTTDNKFTKFTIIVFWVIIVFFFTSYVSMIFILNTIGS